MAQWDQIGQTVTGQQENSLFGGEVSISDDGNTIAVSANAFNSNGLFYNGKVQVYRLINNVWIQIGSDIIGNEGDEELGSSVSLNEDGNIIAIGSEWGNGGNGKVNIYSYEDENWIQMGSTIDGNFDAGNFGTCVSLSNNGQVLGIARKGSNGSYGAHIYEFDGTDWINTGGGNSPQNVFSIRINAEGTFAVYAGQQYIHTLEKVDDVWLTSPNYSFGLDGVNGGSRFLALSGDGNVFARGAELNDDNGNNAGQITIVDRTDPESWEYSYIDGISSFSNLGRAIGLNQDGTKLCSMGGTPMIYEKIDDVWTLTHTILEASHSVSLNAEGNRLIMGYRDFSDPENGNNIGLFKAFGDLPNSSPIIQCPENITFNSQIGQCGLIVELEEIIATDNEDGNITAVQTEGIQSGQFFPVGSHSITYTATDTGELTSSCSYIVTIEDTENPVAICNDITVYLSENGNVSIIPEEIDGGSSDNCEIDSYQLSNSSFSCLDIGTNSVILEVNDASGNLGSCSSSVTVLDSIAPLIECQNLELYLNSEGTIGVSAMELITNYSDNCEINLVEENYSFNCDDLGINMLTVEINDSNGNFNSCVSEVNIIDMVAPQMICQDLTISLDDNGEAFLLPEEIDNGSFDNCSLELNIDLDFFTCENISSNIVILSGIDSSGNQETCSSEVIIIDNLNPEITCPIDQTENLTEDNYVLPDYIALGEIAVSDNCELNLIEITQEPNAGELLGIGNHEITFTVADGSGNLSTCSFDLIIDITDNITDRNQSDMIISPNPSSGNIQVEIGNNSPGEIKIFDQNGRLILHDFIDFLENIDISYLPDGMYVMKIIQKEKIQTSKLFIIH